MEGVLGQFLQALQQGLPVQSQRQGADTLLLEGGVTLCAEIAENDGQEGLLVVRVQICLPDAQAPIFALGVGAADADAARAEVAAKQLLVNELTPVIRFIRRENGVPVRAAFGGEQRNWTLYQGDLVEFVEALPEGLGANALRDIVRDGLLERLGNQRYTWVKLVSLKNQNGVLSNCTINHLKSEALSALLDRQARDWAGKCACKQYLLLVREQPFTPYPYDYAQMARFTRQAVDLFADCSYEEYADRLAARIGDQQLAEDFFSYLPELCAARRYPEVEQREYLFLAREGRVEPELVYKNQLTAWGWIARCLDALFEQGAVSEQAESRCTEYSSLYDAVREATKQGKDLSGGSITLAIPVSEDYVIR